LRKSLDLRTRELFGKDLLCVTNGSFVANGQLVAATGAAARENCAAILALHAGAEAMNFGALAIIRLISTFRHLIPLRQQANPGAAIV
jgi:hypothetical protein